MLARETQTGVTPGTWETGKSQSRLPPLREEAPPRLAALPEAQETKGGGYGLMIILVLLALAAFGIGMAIRFQRDTGGSLLDALKAKHPAPSAPATTSPQ